MTWPTRNHPRICIAGLWKRSTETLLQQEFSWQMGEWKTNMQSSDMVILTSCRSLCSSLRLLGLHRKVDVVRFGRKKEMGNIKAGWLFFFFYTAYQAIPKLAGRDLALREKMFTASFICLRPLWEWVQSLLPQDVSVCTERCHCTGMMCLGKVTFPPCTKTQEVHFIFFWFGWWGNYFRSVAKRA